MQLSSILELGSTRLEIWVGVGWTGIQSTCIGQNLEVGDAEL